MACDMKPQTVSLLSRSRPFSAWNALKSKNHDKVSPTIKRNLLYKITSCSKPLRETPYRIRKFHHLRLIIRVREDIPYFLINPHILEKLGTSLNPDVPIS